MALTKEVIAKLNEASRKARRSRSDYVQLILERYFEHLESEGEKEESNLRAAF